VTAVVNKQFSGLDHSGTVHIPFCILQWLAFTVVDKGSYFIGSCFIGVRCTSPSDFGALWCPSDSLFFGRCIQIYLLTHSLTHFCTIWQSMQHLTCWSLGSLIYPWNQIENLMKKKLKRGMMAV